MEEKTEIPSEQTGQPINIETIEKLLNMGESADVTIYGTLLRKIASGDATIKELQTFDVLHARLKSKVNREDEPIFPNILAVLSYLQEQGWKIKKSALYKHRDDRKIKPRRDGTFTLKEVERYATTHLKRLGPSKQENDLIEELDQLRILEAKQEVRLKTAQADNWEGRNLDIEKAIKTKVRTEISERAQFLSSELSSLAEATSPHIITIVKGDPDKTPELIQYLKHQYAITLDRIYNENSEEAA